MMRVVVDVGLSVAKILPELYEAFDGQSKKLGLQGRFS